MHKKHVGKFSIFQDLHSHIFTKKLFAIYEHRIACNFWTAVTMNIRLCTHSNDLVESCFTQMGKEGIQVTAYDLTVKTKII